MPIVSAIENRRLLAFRYGGHDRVVEPHIYGVGRNGRAALSAYQVRGGSESGEFVGWKLFHVDRMQGTRMLPSSFAGPREGYNPDHVTFSSVYVQL